MSACDAPNRDAPIPTPGAETSSESASIASIASIAPIASVAAIASATPVASAAPDPTPATPDEPPRDDAPRVYAKTRFVWVHYEPNGGSSWTGFLWLGGSAKLRDPSPVKSGAGCPAWYAVEPRGYVCVDGVRATTDRDDPVLRALLPYAPRLDRAYPHSYGESRDTPRYAHIPQRDEQRWREPGLDAHLARVDAIRAGARADGRLVGVDVARPDDTPLELPDLPPSLREDRARLKLLSTVAWSREVRGDDRDWLLSADFLFVPKDRVAPYPVSAFHGVRVPEDAKLPLAFFRGKDRPRYRKDAAGAFTITGEPFARLSWVELTGASEKTRGATYLETREPGVYVDATDAVVPTPQATTPWGAPVGSEDTTGRTPAGRATWLEASVLGGWLIAYEGTSPVYVTMISPGRGGIPVPGKDPLETASTPTGIFPLTGKFATATMVAPNEFIHSDVPWAQNFHGPHAIHGAYWHDRWGERMSAGCVNVSLADGRWLFYWTEPEIPDGWHGTRWEPSLGPATTFVVHP